MRGRAAALDGGVQAALTVPASPYLHWLARYQAFDLLGLPLFVIFGFLWGLSYPQRVAAEDRAEALPAPRPTPARVARSERPSLVGTDVGEARAAPEQPAAGDVPWGDSGSHAVVEPAATVETAPAVAEPESPCSPGSPRMPSREPSAAVGTSGRAVGQRRPCRLRAAEDPFAARRCRPRRRAAEDEFSFCVFSSRMCRSPRKPSRRRRTRNAQRSGDGSPARTRRAREAAGSRRGRRRFPATSRRASSPSARRSWRRCASPMEEAFVAPKLVQQGEASGRRRATAGSSRRRRAPPRRRANRGVRWTAAAGIARACSRDRAFVAADRRASASYRAAETAAAARSRRAAAEEAAASAEDRPFAGARSR